MLWIFRYDLMRKCWQIRLEQRPTFADILLTLTANKK